MSKVFVMGGTGHIGGAILDQLARSSSELTISVLVRDHQKADKVRDKYPKVQCVIGDFAGLDLVSATCRGADIVINAGPDITHDKTFEAALQGLKEGRDGSDKKKPYFIHTSGAYLICNLRQPGGVKEEKVWDDIEDNEQLVSMPDTAVHRATDKVVLSAAAHVNVAIISPGGVTGISPSVAHSLPISTPALFQCVRAFDSTFVIGQGENAMGMVHVQDLARMYMVLVDNAVATLTGSNKTTTTNTTEPPFPLWGEKAYYFGSAVDSLYRRDWMTGITPLLVMHGVIGSDEVKSVSTAEVARRVLFGDDYDPDAPPPPLDSWATHIANGFGANLRVRASKMRKLGWEPQHISFMETMSEIIPAYLKLEKESAARK
ncbi:hypothetical protein PG995_012143 [Apiospora arundinis]